MTSPSRSVSGTEQGNRTSRLLFITGTDTGVGKTVLTALLIQHLRDRGVRALAMKPFCSGGRGDARFLNRLMDGELTLDELNPFFFEEPLTPLICARKARREIRIEEVLRFVQAIAKRCDVLLLEGAGGVCSPLGEGFAARELIAQLNCEAIVVARNRLGTINHTFLTVRALQGCQAGRRQELDAGCLRVVLMGAAHPDLSSRDNALCLKELLSPVQVDEIPFLGPASKRIEGLKKNAEKFHKMLARILGIDSV